MAKDNIKKALKECEKYKSDIMDKVIHLLSSKSIKFTSNKKKTELVLSDTKEKEIKSLLLENLSIPKDTVKLLIDVKESNNHVYIRQKFN